MPRTAGHLLQPQPLEEAATGIRRRAAPASRLLDVLGGGQVRVHAVGGPLGHPGDDPAAVRPALAGAQRGGVAAQDRHVTAAGPVAQREQGQQGRLAAARRAGQGGDGVLVELGVDPAQGVGLTGGRGVDLHQAGDRGGRAGTVGEGHRAQSSPRSTSTVDCDDAASDHAGDGGQCRQHQPAGRGQQRRPRDDEHGLRGAPVARLEQEAAPAAAGPAARAPTGHSSSARTTATSSARARPGACRPAPVHASIRSAAGRAPGQPDGRRARPRPRPPPRTPARGRSGSGGPAPRRRRPGSRAPARGCR